MATMSTHPSRLQGWSFSTRISSSSYHPPRLRSTLSIVLLLVCFATTASARGDTKPSGIISSASLVTPTPTLVSDEERLIETLTTADWEQQQVELRRRSNSEDDDEKDESSTTSTKTKDSEDKKGSKTTFTISIEQGTSTAASNSSPLPQPFDGNLASEFTSSSGSKCPTFLNSLLASPSFEACYPLSMLIQTSRGFFDAQKQLLSIVRVLDATCAANVTYCTDYLSTAARNLTAPENCKTEWNRGDATVKQVLFGLKAYEMMYKASCLQNPSNDMYCFANAVTNLTTPSDAYFYYLPYNLSLPGSSLPSCSWCIEETMAIFHAASADRSQVIANTYEAAARQVNTICGIDFVNSTLPKEEVSSTSIIIPSSFSLVMTILGASLLTLLL